MKHIIGRKCQDMSKISESHNQCGRKIEVTAGATFLLLSQDRYDNFRLRLSQCRRKPHSADEIFTQGKRKSQPVQTKVESDISAATSMCQRSILLPLCYATISSGSRCQAKMCGVISKYI